MTAKTEPAPAAGSPAATLAQRLWRGFCRAMTVIFYRRFEVGGLHHLPADGPVVLCANHVNALVDAVVVQAACPRPIHPLARSGLFRRALLRPILRAIQAVPVYRRGAHGGTRERNEASFARCFDYLGEGRILLIFPEGQSHSDPMLRPLKTGAARLALGHAERAGEPPTLIPVGLTFTNKGRFRSRLLVLFGPPIPARPESASADTDQAPEEAVQGLTREVERGLGEVTLNVDNWEDLALLRRLDSFFAFRRGRHGRGLQNRFRSLQRLIATHRWLRLTRPDEVTLLSAKLHRFEQLCAAHGVQDYQLNLEYRPAVVLRFLFRSLVFVVLVLPLAIWGALNSALPFGLTRMATRWMARGRDQYDTAGMVLGLLFFALFWGAQTLAVGWRYGYWPAGFYAAILPPTAAIALLVGRERRRIVENVRVFFLFLRRSELRSYLQLRRRELEVDLARLARIARQALRTPQT